jgi:4-hydroxy-2-oxoheptanedioate aldolase
MKMRRSRVLQKLRAGQVATCTKLNLGDPRAAEIAALCGIDCLWVDQEHVSNGIETIEHGIRAAKACGSDTLVRVGRGSYSDLVRPLEADAAGVMVPHVMSGEEAEEIGRRTKFHPIGRRPLDGGNVDAAYTMVPMPEYLRHANEQHFVAVQIEDPEALDQLDRIAAAPGVDLLFFGPGDLSQGLGHPGEFDQPRIHDARKQVAEAAQRHGKFAGTVASPASLPQIVALGYRFVSVGADVAGLAQYFTKIAAAFARVTAHPEPDAPARDSVYAADDEPD